MGNLCFCSFKIELLEERIFLVMASQAYSLVGNYQSAFFGEFQILHHSRGLVVAARTMTCFTRYTLLRSNACAKGWTCFFISWMTFQTFSFLRRISNASVFIALAWGSLSHLPYWSPVAGLLWHILHLSAPMYLKVWAERVFTRRNEMQISSKFFIT